MNNLKLIVNERRRGVSPIPSLPGRYINDNQINSAISLRKYGWRIVCVRRSFGQPAVIILKNRHDDAYGILSVDGTLSVGSDIKIRDPHNLNNQI